ncbi:MAG TPA: hypothetical protein VGM67_15590 [Gemmatimonadaceae bacterium]
MARTRIQQEIGVALCTCDFSHLVTDEAALDAIEEARSLMGSATPKSLLVLTDITGSRLTLPVIAALRDLVAQNEPFVRKSAVIGMSVVHRVALNQIMRLTGREIHEFPSREFAMDWLRTP